MRQAKLPWLLFVLALVAIVVPIAQGTSAAKDPRVPALTKRIAALEKSVNALVDKSNCLTAQGLVLRGGGATNTGYVYTPDNGTTYELRTAVDAPAQGEAPQLLMAVINPQCVTGSRAFARSTQIWSSKAAPYRATR